MKKLILFFLAFGLLASCGDDSIKAKKSEDMGNCKVFFLFEKDGVKVYRFYDKGHTHYFTTLGETITTQSQTRTSGKTSHTEYWPENINQPKTEE